MDLVAPAPPGYTAPGSLTVGVPIAAMNPSGGAGIDEYAAPGLPPGLSIHATTGAISGTPDTAEAGAAEVTVTVSDSAGNPATVDITFPAVDKGDQTLSGFQYSAASVRYGATAPAVTPPTGERTTLSYSASPDSVCTVDAATGALTLVGAGQCVVTVTAAGTADYNEASDTFTVTVQAIDQLALNVNAIATDDTINIAEKASGFAISGDTGTETGVTVIVGIGGTTLDGVTSDGAGVWSVGVPGDASYITGTSVAVSVSASKTGFTSPSAEQRALTVDLVAPAPPGYTAPGSLTVGVPIAAMNPSGGVDVAAHDATGLPPGLDISSTTGAISGTPETAETGTALATVTVMDTAGNPATVDITFPAVEKGDQALAGFQYSAASVRYGDAAPAVTPPTGEQTTLSYSASPDTVCTAAAATGALTLVGAGDCVITVTAAGSDDYNEASDTFTVAVQPAGTLALNLDAIATDNTINIAEKASGFAISGDTGSVGEVSVTVTVGETNLTATSSTANPATWSVSVPRNASYIAGTSVAVAVNASKTGYSPPGAEQRALTVDLVAPAPPGYTAPGSLTVGVPIAAMNPSGGVDVAAHDATGLPPGLDIDTASGAISGTPGTANASTALARVTATDTAGNPATVDITFPAVDKGDQTLSGFQYSAASVEYGAAAPTVTEPTGERTTLSYSATPATVCTAAAATGALTLVGAGDCVITVTAAGTADYNEASDTFTVAVQPAGTLALNLDAIATDDTINIAERLAGFAITGDTGTETGVTVIVGIGGTTLDGVTSDGAGVWSVGVPGDASYITGTSVAVSVSASKTGFTSPSAEQRTLTVDLVAPAPPGYTAPGSLTVGVPIAAMNPSGGAGIDEYAAPGLPPGLSIHATTGAISGTPDTAEAGAAEVTVTVSDSAGNADTVDITFPAVDKGDQTLSGFQYSAASVEYGAAAPTVTEPTGERTTLSYSATPATVCTAAAATGVLTLVGAGDCVITVTAAGSDDYNEASDTFTVAVQPAGTLALNLDAIATDNTINIAEKASGFAISGDTGSVGEVSVTVTVGETNLTATSSTANPATWSVSVPADAAYITGTSVAVAVNASKTGYSPPGSEQRTLTVDLVAPAPPGYTAPGSLTVGVPIAAMNPSGGAGIDEYAAPGLPPGLSIHATTGAISGTPDTAEAGAAEVTVTVSDSAGNPATVDITFPAVDKGDQTLSGFQYSAASVRYGAAAPTVTEPTGERTTLSYSATPATVCTAAAATGVLTLVGAGDCVVTVTAAGSDDYNEASDTFTVAVQPAGTLALNLDAIATDDTINIAEKASGFAISGDTGSVGGVDVTVGIGAATLTATSADEAGTAAWSVSVPADAAYITGTSVAVAVNASKTGYSPPGAEQRALTVDLVAPAPPGYTAPGSLTVGVPIAAMNPSGGVDVAAHDATGLPPGLDISSTTGAISGTPETAETGTALATVTVMDTAGNPATVDITFPAVDKGDQALAGFRYGAASVRYGDAAPAVTPPTGEQTTLSYSASPDTVCTAAAATGALTLVGAGDCVITVTAAGSDDYNEASDTFTVAVQPAGTLALNLDAIATDNTINIAEKASGFAISGDTGSVGEVSVTVTVGETNLTATSSTANPATWSVSVPADAAYITGTSVAVAVNASKTGYSPPGSEQRALTVDLVAPAPPGYTAPGSLTVGVPIAAMNPSGGAGIDEYAAPGLPSGLSIHATTGAISGTPDTAEAGAAEVTVTATDTAGNPATVDITFPAVAKGDQTLSGFQYSAASVEYGAAAPTVTAPTGEQGALSYSASPDTVCTAAAATGVLTLVGAGDCVITVTAAGTADYNEASDTFTVAVQPAGTLALNVNAIATDDTINIAEKASGFAISGDTGTETGVTVIVGIGGTTLTATSADEAGTAAWSVSVPADAAYITGTSVAVAVNASKTGYSPPGSEQRTLTVDLVAPAPPGYTAPGSLTVGVPIAAMNPSGGVDVAAHDATGLPPGLDIDTASGAISGTPGTANASTALARVTATDTAGNPATVDIAFPAVDKGDQALAGFQYSAASVRYGDAAPAVTPPTGEQTTLSYSASPDTVCTAAAATGALTLVGAGDCVITVTAAGSDDYNEASDTFTVAVQPAGTLALNLDAIATDDTINIAEKASGFAISGRHRFGG